MFYEIFDPVYEVTEGQITSFPYNNFYGYALL